ncbi:neprilysin-3-like [Amblyomma americanum]
MATGRTTATTTSGGERPSADAFRLAAQLINESLYWAYQPCDDFYKFVCSRFEGGISTLSKIEQYTRRSIQEMLLNTTGIRATGQSAADKAAAMFQACVRLGSSPTNSEVASLKSFLRGLDLDFSTMRTDPNFNVWDRMTQLSLVYGLHTFVKFEVTWTNRRPREPILQISINADDEKWMENSYMQLGGDLNTARSYSIRVNIYDPNIQNVSAFAARIVRIEHVVREQIRILRRNARDFVQTSLQQLGKYTNNTVSQAQWQGLIPNYTLTPRNFMWVWKNATAIVVLFMDSSRMHLEDSRILLAWSLVRRLLELSHGRELARKARTAHGRRPDAVRQFCYETVSSIMAPAVQRRYFEKFVPGQALSSARQVLLNVRSSLLRKLRTTDWIRAPLKNITIEKAENYGIVVGYPDAISSEAAVEALYADFPDVGAAFFDAYLQSLRVITDRNVRGVGLSNFSSDAANAQYEAHRHTITVFAGLLLPPVYIHNGPPSFNYAGFGQIAGHEMMHAFDVEGITYDLTGHELRFQATSTMMEYERKVLCLRRSYQETESEARARAMDDKIDSEGFADFSGMLLTYDAFQRLPLEQRGLNVADVGLTADQTFFVAHCLKWCNADKANRRRYSGSLYWHGRSRCLVPLINMPEFAQAFACRPGDMMNPARRCDFW